MGSVGKVFLTRLVLSVWENDVCIRETGILGNEIDDVHSETGNSLVEPEAKDIMNFAPDGGGIPVQVGLEWTKEGEVILIRLVIVCPGRLVFVKETVPIVWWLTNAIGVVLWLSPVVPVSMLTILGRRRVNEPGVLSEMLDR